MTTLVTIPNVTAYHLPTPTSDPLPLSTGELNLTLIPANPPTHPSSTITLNVGGSSFPLLPNSPVQKVQAKEQHPSYIFAPVPADGGAPVGQVKLRVKDSANQGEWDATESLATKFEEALKANKLWNETTLFVDDEFETGETAKHTQKWGETIAGAVTSAGQALAERLGAYTDRHVARTNPEHPAPPSDLTKERAEAINHGTSQLAESVEEGANKVGSYVHDAAKSVGEKLPDSIAKSSEPVKEEDKGQYRKMAEEGWEQITIAAKGIAGAAMTVGSAASQSAHRAVEHNFGKEAEGVAQDVGQTGANLGSTALSAGKATSVIMQGTNAAQGASAAKQGE
ncbi:uncharacterized protein I303_100556 [Kwoniella dejecticola CBS 10117]|uniref:Senescence domain-containing protein n=1 Tax=Kwoniella dejecticola CBS 10117 TaxID=1296121 RepID=A0A1A6AF93_9TREE|nr:uncharacterized protein I303_00557 [Kwoniella dejecticola CBS 10117]OBR88740.1 hypothetical protein I303_00557 [Kwoniella dejecticola CBS 10117]